MGTFQLTIKFGKQMSLVSENYTHTHTHTHTHTSGSPLGERGVVVVFEKIQ
jgi:hypothetical protein